MHADPMIEFVTARLGERKKAVQGTPENPEKLLAQLEATRKIVANARTSLEQTWQLGEEAREAVAHIAVRTLQHLAQIDADHPDYDPAWQL